MDNKLKRTLAGVSAVAVVLSTAVALPDGAVHLPSIIRANAVDATDATEDNSAIVVAVDEEHFPDEIFRNYILENFDLNGDGSLSAYEIANVTEIALNDMGISDLTGIKYFTALKYLECSYNNLTALDVSGLTSLEYLYCYFNDLETLDVSGLTSLQVLNCFYNDLTTLDVSELTSLEYLICYDNKLPSLDVSGLTSLVELDCGYNKFETLDVSGLTSLQVLTCYYNRLETIDLSGLTSLKELDCSHNYLEALDLSGLNSLEQLYCNYNFIKSLDVKGFTALKSLRCNDNSLETLDVSGLTALEELDCYVNGLTSLDLSGLTSLKDLDCENNSLEALDFSELTALEELKCGYNNLTSLDLSKLTALKELYCSYNSLASLDVSRCTELIWISCRGNSLTDLDVSGLTGLEGLYCSGNKLAYLDLSNNLNIGLYNYEDNVYDIAVLPCVAEGGLIEASVELPNGFDATRASDWSGASYNEATGKLDISSTSNYITYTYDLGNGSSEAFKMHIVYEHEYEDGKCTRCGGLGVTEENFPDDNFRDYVSTVFDTNSDGVLSDDEIASVTWATITERNISDFTGIKYFTELTSLDCYYNNLTTLDLSGLTKLNYLDCYESNIESLNLSGCTALEYLYCENNNLTELDVSEFTKLKYLSCNRNKISSIDLSNNTELEWASFYVNDLTTLDVSKNTKLEVLDCGCNKLTSIDVSGLDSLTYYWGFYCEDNSYDIGTVTKCSDYKKTVVFPGDFDYSRTSNWVGGTYDNETNTLTIDDDAEKVTYDYETGYVGANEKDSFATFTLTFTRDEHDYAEIADEKYLASEATCDENAVYYVSCVACGEKNEEETFEAEGTKLGHSLTKTEAKAPTCTEDGNVEYWSCDRCGKLFADEEGTVELENVVTEKTGHSYVDGKCTVCGEVEPTNNEGNNTSTPVDSNNSTVATTPATSTVNDDTSKSVSTAPTTDSTSKSDATSETASKSASTSDSSPATGRNAVTAGATLALLAGAGLAVRKIRD